MPGPEFRMLPRLPLEYKTYKIISPAKIGKAMTAGWTPVAAINFEEMKEGVGQFAVTRFLIGKGATTRRTGASPTPVLMFPQAEAEGAADEDSDSRVQQLLDRIALMSQEEILTLHTELQEQRQKPAPDPEGDEDEAVTEAMDELLGDDDGTDDDDDE